ncbi:9301_t:CDS:2, partial [Paraglomus brasilianum]
KTGAVIDEDEDRLQNSKTLRWSELTDQIEQTWPRFRDVDSIGEEELSEARVAEDGGLM